MTTRLSSPRLSFLLRDDEACLYEREKNDEKMDSGSHGL